LIEDNPESLGKWLKETDAAGIKRVWNTFLYLRGMQSRVGLKSIPVDLIVFDELDEAPQKAVDMAMERMGHSEFKEVLMLSNPTIPDYGIDQAFQKTDQRYWLMKCPACGHYTCLEDTFPDCLKEVKGRGIRACGRCQSELDPDKGEWVAKRPGITEKRGITTRSYSAITLTRATFCTNTGPRITCRISSTSRSACHMWKRRTA
jgi:phage terminase large subunit GpA-like protein